MSFDSVLGHRTHSYNSVTDDYAVSVMGAMGRSSTVRISYDAAAKTYLLQNAVRTANFAPQDLVSSTGDVQNFVMGAGSAMTDRLALYGNLDPAAAAAGNSLQLSYASFARWEQSNTTTGVGQTDYLLFGFPTTTARMPTSGTASYSGTVSAHYVDVREMTTGTFGGSMTLSANFGTGQLNTEMMVGYYPASPIATVQGTATIGADQFNGLFTTGSNMFHSGGFHGGFFGPNADEVGYTFWLRLTPQDPYAGASLRYSDYRVVGVAVGNKD